MRSNTIIFLSAALLLLLAGCKSQFEALLMSNDADAKYKAAMQLFEDEKYKKAGQMFESLSMLTSGTDRDDTVKYYYALSTYRDQDYYSAETNFTSYLELYPPGDFSVDAAFLKLDCMYRASNRYELDQAPTKAAIYAISEYVMQYPDSPKLDICRKMLEDLEGRLDEKAYQAAYLYFRMEDYIASRTAFKNVLKNNADSRHREDIVYYIALSAYRYADLSVATKQKERFMDFVDEYYNFIGEYPESAYRKELDRCYDRAQDILHLTPTDNSNKK